MSNANTVKTLSIWAKENWKMVHMLVGALMLIMLTVVVYSYLRTPTMTTPPAVELWWKAMRDFGQSMLFLGAVLMLTVEYLKRLHIK